MSLPPWRYRKKGAEVDFHLKEKLEIKRLVPVCFDVKVPCIKKREYSKPCERRA
jgi:predicted AAA+ superfamily ATPase